MTRKEAQELGLSVVGGVIYHTSKHRGCVALKENVQFGRVYYVFKHGGHCVAVRKEAILEAFKEE